MGQNQTYADELRIITLTPDVSTYNTIDALIIAASVDLVKGAKIQVNLIPAATATLKDQVTGQTVGLIADEVRMFPALNFTTQFALISADTVACEVYIEKD